MFFEEYLLMFLAACFLYVSVSFFNTKNETKKIIHYFCIIHCVSLQFNNYNKKKNHCVSSVYFLHIKKSKFSFFWFHHRSMAFIYSRVWNESIRLMDSLKSNILFFLTKQLFFYNRCKFEMAKCHSRDKLTAPLPRRNRNITQRQTVCKHNKEN